MSDVPTLNPVWPPHPDVWAGVVPEWQQVIAGSVGFGNTPSLQTGIDVERNVIGIAYVKKAFPAARVIRSFITVPTYLSMPEATRKWLEDCGISHDRHFKPEWRVKR